MLGIMEKEPEAKPVGQPPEDASQMKSPPGPAKVKSSTITMFFKSPPKEPAKPVVKSPDIMGYFKPIGNANAHQKPNKRDESNKGGDKTIAVASKDANKGSTNLSKDAEDTRSKKDATGGGAKKKAVDKKKTTKAAVEAKSKVKVSKLEKVNSKIKSQSTMAHGDEKDGKKSTTEAKIKNDGTFEEANLSLEDFDTSKPEKSKKSKTTKQSKSSRKKMVLEDDQIENMLAEVDEVLSNCHKDADVPNNINSCEVPESQSTNVITYRDYLETEGNEVDEEDDDEMATPLVDESKTDADDSVVISYTDFLTQASEGEEEEENQEERNDNENNHLSRELSDVDMADTVTEESQVSMDTGTTSDEDVFKSEDDDSAQASKSQDVSRYSSGDQVLTVSVNATPEPSKPKKVQFSKLKDEKKKAASSETTETKSQQEDDDNTEFCLPKRKEVKVTAQVHTPPMITPVASPSTSPGHSPGTRKSNVVVDAADMDLEVIHVEDTNIDSKPQSENVFNFSAASTPNRDASSETSVKPAPTKLYSIFQKKSSVKDSSKVVPGTDSKDNSENVDKTQKTSSKKVGKTGDQSNKGSEKKTPATKKLSKKVKTAQTETTELESKQTADKDDIKKDTSEGTKGKKSKLSLGKNREQPDATPEPGRQTELESKQTTDKDDIQKDKSEGTKGKKSKLSLGKNKEQPDATPEPGCQKKNKEQADDTPESGRRRSSGRAAAIKARKDILEQELKHETTASESATSQEDVPPPKKRTLKELFPTTTTTDTDASEQEGKPLQNSSSKKGKQTKLKQGKILTKQRAVIGSDEEAGEKQNLKSPGAEKRKAAKRKSSGESGDTSSKGGVKRKSGQPLKGEASSEVIVKRKRGRPPKAKASEEDVVKRNKELPLKEELGKAGMLRKGPVMTSSPKANKNLMKKAKARQLVQKAKTRQAASKASPSKPKKSRTKSQDSIVVLDSSVEETPTQTKALRNFKDVLGKKVVAKEMDVKKKKGVTKGKNVITKDKETKKLEGNKTEDVDKKKKQGKSKPLADKKTDPPSQDKVPVKLCPLFTKEGRLAASRKQAEMIEANSQASMPSPDDLMVLSDEDSCDTRMSQGGGTSSGPLNFSGIVASMKRKDLEKKAEELPYPPFPSVSHVLQQDKDNSQLWNLPSPSLPSLTKELLLTSSPVLPLTKFKLGAVTLCDEERTSSDCNNYKEFRGHEELSFETQRVLLEDIGKCNPKVQVRKLFKRYLAKRKGDPPPASKSATDKLSDKFTKLKAGQASSGKRKSEAILEENESTGRRKRSRQDPESEEKDTKSTRLRRSNRSQPQEPQEVRRSKRKSAQGKEVKGQEKSEVKATDDTATTVVKEKDEATLKAEKLASMLWTEKYQPACAVEVMGNTACVKKLSGWLDEWRKRFVKEKKKIKKQQMKGAAKKQDMNAADSDSDFEMSASSSDSDSDYSDDEYFLCNTMLISGPAGAGKTASVYACAQEHGFKVFEVNASSRRVGRQILAELGEATQSHHVATRPGAMKGINSFFTPGPKRSPANSPSKSPARRKKAAEQRKKPPIPKVFANFFKTAAGSGEDKNTTKNSPKSKTKNQPAKKKKGKEEPPAVTMTTKKKIEAPLEKTIPSTSIILFEEVDVVFEEDKGFLAAIASFMETTKRPMILTTSDPRFASNFEGQFESLIFKRPSPTLLATHLQLLALAENVFTNPQDMKLVAQHLKCDIRQSVVALQYWISSGAKRTCAAKNGSELVAMVTDKTGVSRKSKSNKVVEEPEKNATNITESRTDNSVKLMDIEGKLDVIGEYHGNKKDRRPSLESRYQEVIVGEASRQDCCLECIMGVCNQTGMEKELKHTFQLPESTSTLSTQSSVAETYQHLSQSEVTYNNFHHLLPQQQSQVLPQSDSVNSTSKLGKKLVSTRAKYLDRLSFMDATFPPVHDGMPQIGCPSNQGWWQAEFKASMLDLPREEEELAGYHENVLQSGIRAALEVLSFSSCKRRYQRLLAESGGVEEKAGKEETDASSKKDDEGSDKKTCNIEDVWPCVDSTDIFRLRAQETKCPEVYPVVAQRLPYHIYCSHESMACDYLPAIRQICRSERWRQEAQLKRRFLHYLDYNAMSLKTTEYLKLASALDVQPNKPPQEDSFLSAI